MTKCFVLIRDISRTGGTERAVSNLCDMLLKKGNSVTLISVCSSDGKSSYYPLPEDLYVVHLNMKDPPVKVLRKFVWFYTLFLKLRKIISSKAVVIGTGHNLNVIITLLRRYENVIIGCEHIQKESIPFSSRILQKLFYPKLNALVVLSETARKKYTGYNRNLFIIPNALPFAPLLNKRIPNHNIIMVGRIDSNKGYERAIPIFQYVNSYYPLWSINIFGTGPNEKALKEELLERKLNKVSVNSPTSNIVDKYLGSSIMIMTSYSEAMPMVILEANICGIPVVAYKNEGTQELIKDEKTGFLVEDGDENSFKNKLSVLLSSDSVREQMSMQAIKYAKTFSPLEISNSWETLISNLEDNGSRL